jgi:hypothetical protein
MSKQWEDSFLIQNLNPLLLEALKDYDQTLEKAKVEGQENKDIEEAQFNLLRFAVRHLFRPLYLKYKASKIQGTIFLTSAVHSDGIGDFISLLKCTKLIHKNFENIQSEIVYTHKQKLPEIVYADYGLENKHVHDFLENESANSQIIEPILEKKPLQDHTHTLASLIGERERLILEFEQLATQHPQAAAAIKTMFEEVEHSIYILNELDKKQADAQSVYQGMQKAKAIIHISLAINTFDNPDFASNSLYFAEAGNFQGIANYLQRNWFSFGVESFDEGLFLETKPDAKWINQQFTKYLWDVEQPQQSHLDNYFKNHVLYVGYLPRVVHQKDLFIDLVCENHLQDELDIDIILVRNDVEEERSLDRDWMVRFGISKIVVVDGLDNYKEIELLSIDIPSTKILRLIYAMPLPQSDFLKLLEIASEIVGCTGDGSLGDCIQMEKIPFYEVRQHKIKNLQAFFKMARALMLPDVMDYFQLLEMYSIAPSETYVYKFKELITSEVFKSQWKDLIKFVKQFYQFENHFIAEVNRHLILSEDPSIAETELLLTRDLFKKSTDAEKIYLAMDQLLKSSYSK